MDDDMDGSSGAAAESDKYNNNNATTTKTTSPTTTPTTSPTDPKYVQRIRYKSENCTTQISISWFPLDACVDNDLASYSLVSDSQNNNNTNNIQVILYSIPDNAAYEPSCVIPIDTFVVAPNACRQGYRYKAVTLPYEMGVGSYGILILVGMMIVGFCFGFLVFAIRTAALAWKKRRDRLRMEAGDYVTELDKSTPIRASDDDDDENTDENTDEETQQQKQKQKQKRAVESVLASLPPLPLAPLAPITKSIR